MRIAIDAHVFDEKFQGSRTYLEGMYLEAIHLRPEWKFFFIARNTANLQSIFGVHPNVHYLSLASKNKYRRLLLELPRLLKEYKIDYAHFQYITPLKRVCRYLVTTHDVLFFEPSFKKYFPFKYRFINGSLFKRSARESHLVFTVSEYSKQKILQFFRLSPSKVFVTPNAVQEPYFETDKEYIKKNYGIEKFLLYVSRVEPRKNHLALAKAFVNLKLYEKGYSLVFIGAKDLPYPELDSFIQKQPESIKSVIHQFPGIAGADLQQFYANAEVFIYPSLAEGFGIPPLEAAMVGTPVICSNATAMKYFSFFKHHIDPENLSELENALEEVIRGNVDNPEAIKEEIRSRYSWKLSAEVMLKAIEESHQRK